MPVLEIGIIAGIVLVLAASLEVGFRFGRRAAGSADPHGGGQLGAVQGALLGLLGLLLAFSFGGAASRFIERQDLIVREANAIGTAYLRADMLDEPYRSNLRTGLEQYARYRIAVSAHLRTGVAPEVLAQVRQQHDQIWKAASGGVAARPASMVAVLTPVNEVIDLHATRVATSRKHLPKLVLGLLLLSSTIALAAIGYGCGLSGRRYLAMTGSLVFIVTAALWTTIDLDHARVGLIQVSDAPLKELSLNGSR